MKTKTLRLPDQAVIGMAVMHHGQRFELFAAEPYVTHRGVKSQILRWRSHCATCGQPYAISTGAAVWTLSRRCPTHHAPGPPVREMSLLVPLVPIATVGSASGGAV